MKGSLLLEVRIESETSKNHTKLTVKEGMECGITCDDGEAIKILYYILFNRQVEIQAGASPTAGFSLKLHV